MVLLYRDPEGETIGSISQARSSAVGSNHVSQVNTITNIDWEEKVTTLEKALSERDAKIATLMKSHS